MIHPINLPEELLAANPTRPTLIELRRKPRITYAPDGRRLRNGLPTTPQSPNCLWASTFVRGFVHRMAYDARAEVEETSSAESLIDIVDLQPPTEQNEGHDLRDPIVSPDVELEKFSFGKLGASATVDNSKVPDRVDPFAEYHEQAEPTGILRRSSAQFKKTTRSSIVDHDVISPILQPCCSSAELKHFPLKEFLRFDFSNTAFFHTKVSTLNVAPVSEPSDVKTSRPSMTLVPHSIGSRIWLNKPTSPRLAPRSQLCFAVKAIKVEKTTLVITMTVRNTHAQALNLETEVHVHAAHAQTIGRLALSQTYSFSLSDASEHDLSLRIELASSELVNCALRSDEYVVVTLLGVATPAEV
uniref:Uncharacterized protein n=1 Tax=Panagrellus redivivus TaxID=6233 RepID=A0A7E4UMH1_PANRE